MVTSRSKSAAEAAANQQTTKFGTFTQKISSGGENANEAPTKPGDMTSKKTATNKVSTRSSLVAKKNSNGRKKKEVYCNCMGEDDGTPMIKCEGLCQNWYHFHCIDLSEDVAGEIEKYICPDCETKTNMKTIMDFEGMDAVVEADTDAMDLSLGAIDREESEVVESTDDTEGEGSEDDYVGEVGRKRIKTNKTFRRQSLSSIKSDSDSDDGSEGIRRKRLTKRNVRTTHNKKSSMPPPVETSTMLKRRSSSATQSSSKKLKTRDSESGRDDPLRKYCLTKLEEIIKPMFLESFEFEAREMSESGVNDENKDAVPSELTEEQQQIIDQKASSFVTELERCMMDVYAEPDKQGATHAGGKYKERFRMLSFNLAKPDRVALRKGIASGRITPSQLNVMSSTDLANEQTKHEIEVAEKEALEHSILQRVTAPRAKITHKGLETIEDVAGHRNTDIQKEEEEQRMEIEKREREKLAKLRSIGQSESSPTSLRDASPLSAALMSPNHTRSSWGFPPALPTHALQHLDDQPPLGSPTTSRPSVRPLFVPTVNDFSSVEDGLNLADIINMDDDGPTQDAEMTSPESPFQRSEAHFHAQPSSSIATQEIVAPSGPSPFAATRPLESPKRTSFDLNALWTGSEKTGSPVESKPALETRSVDIPDESREEAMDIDSVDDNDDRDFDAILEQNEKPAQGHGDDTLQTDLPNANDSIQVWSGQVSMPVEGSASLAPSVVARQIGGRTLESQSGYWQILFPAPITRIDGRVPVDKSSQYLVATRLNPQKELIAVCFTPAQDDDAAKFNELIEFFVEKKRHALVFPWGVHPKPSAPGRELYLIPLLTSEPLPEYIELLDNLHLSKERPTDLLLGVFVLNRGKLVLSSPTTFANPPLPVAVSESMSSALQSTQPYPSSMSGIAALQNVLPQIPPSSATHVLPNVAPVSAPNIDHTALAAEVASLTPEQLSLMWHHLRQNMTLPSSAIASTSSGPSAASSSAFGPSYASQFASYAPSYQQQLQAPPQTSLLPASGHISPTDQPGYDDYDYDDNSGRPYGREERAGRGRGRGRGHDRKRGGRGRGRVADDERGGQHRRDDFRTPDAGWGGRGRGRGTSTSPIISRRTHFDD